MADDPYAAIAHDPYASIASAPAASPTPKPGKSLLQNVGDAASSAYRNVGAARTAAARDPVGALANVLGGLQGGVAGLTYGDDLKKMNTYDLGSVLSSEGRSLWRGVTDPAYRQRANDAMANDVLGSEKQDPTTLDRIGRGLGNFALQTATDPLTVGGKPIVGGALSLAKPAAQAIARGVAPVGEYVDAVKTILADPRLQPAIAKVAHGVQTLTAPFRGGVDAAKDLLFLNPFPHGVGNMTINNFLANGLGTAIKGIKYGVMGAPKATKAELERMGAGAYTPELLDKPSPWGPVGWMSALGARGVPAAVRAGVGGAAGAGIADKTKPDNATPWQRAIRDTEGGILGALTGASPEALNVSNKIMSRLETGHRAAMLEGLPRPAGAARDVAPKARPLNAPPANVDPVTGEYTPVINLNPHAISPNASSRLVPQVGFGKPRLTPAQVKAYYARLAPNKAAAPPKPPADTRAQQINDVFGGGEKSGVARLASALGGPFAQWQFDVVPRVVGNAIKDAPRRVEAIARAQDITNRDVLKGKPYKMQTGGPVGGAAKMVFNPVKYGQDLFGPLGGLDGSEATNPKTLSAEDKLKDFVYEGTPGREVVGPFFGDTKYKEKEKAPAIPSAALSALLGWHMANKSPRQDAILSIMRASGLDAQKAGYLYDRFKR